jgi:hypothetical protein
MVRGQRYAPAALPPGNTRYLLYRRLGGPQGRPERVRKISPLPGFDPRNFHSVASRYTDWAIPAPHTNMYTVQKMKSLLLILQQMAHIITTGALKG